MKSFKNHDGIVKVLVTADLRRVEQGRKAEGGKLNLNAMQNEPWG